ncbi:Signal peptidase I [Candidatus Terasakiella magnetica]|uniref:Signal peptidase I n=1 Tax=Candidatus Terasakiella magnetica TaxID=1867952 RepID=A0A1C3RCZ0_9PROT|nr:signal peptidase I [Candidatus Terasakiella magnetica]SCA55094.1 Signal peptidase I [Candidatus Terasakiella magnetica]
MDTIKTVFWAIVLALGIRTIAYEPFNIPSGSMKPTLLIGDYLFVSKFSYGYSTYSLPFGVNLFDGRVLETQPERGDVAVFKLPTDTSKDYIKRIVGLPGDKIQVVEGILHINGEAVKREEVGEFVTRNQHGSVQRVTKYIETLPNGVVHEIAEENDNWHWSDSTPVYTVPPEHYFAMGDNRDHSQDSRWLTEVGFIPAKNLVGRAEFLFYSKDTLEPIWDLSSIRFSRLFTGIE